MRLVVAVVVVLTLALVLDLAVLEADGDDLVLVRSHLRCVRMTFGLKKDCVSIEGQRFKSLRAQECEKKVTW